MILWKNLLVMVEMLVVLTVGNLWPEDGPGPPSDEEVANEELDWN